MVPTRASPDHSVKRVGSYNHVVEASALESVALLGGEGFPCASAGL